MLFVLFTCAINAPQSQWVASLEPSSSVILSQVQLWVHLVQPLQHPVPVAVPKVSQAWFSLIFCFGFLRMRARTCMHNHEEKWRQVRQNHSSRQIAKYSQRSCVLVLPRNYLRKSWFQTFRRNINGPRGRWRKRERARERERESERAREGGSEGGREGGRGRGRENDNKNDHNE